MNKYLKVPTDIIDLHGYTMHGIHFNPAKQADGGDGALEVFLK